MSARESSPAARGVIPVPSLRVVAAVPLACFGATALALHLAGQAGSFGALCYVGAILLVALLRHEPGTWPALLLLGAAAHLAAHLLHDGRAAIALVITACGGLEVLLAATALHRLGEDGPWLASARQVRLLAGTALLAPIAPVTLGSVLLALLGAAPFAMTWPAWCAADVLGLLIVTPFLLSWTEPGSWRGALRRRWPEAALHAGLVLGVTALVFAQERLPFPFLVFPFLLLATLRAGLWGASTAAVALAVGATWLTAIGRGPFAAIPDPTERIQALQLYLAVVLLSTLLVAVLLEQCKALAGRLREAKGTAEAAQHRAEAANRSKADFLAAMSHEIRTPMTGVLGMADLLAAGKLPRRERGYVETIRTSGRHLLSIINDILDFSRVEAGGLVLERVDFPLAEVLEQVRSLIAPQAAERGLNLSFELDERSPPVVKGDPTRLKQVLLNLVGNGLKFTPHGGVTLRVRSEETGSGLVRLRFEVEDTGIGMTPEQVAGLFRPFAQADQSTARRYGGSGLGLAISKRLVGAMGGEIGVESASNAGCQFWFEVPLERGDVVVAAERIGLTSAAVPPLCLLLAEDVEVNRALLGEVLGRQGHAVTFATNGAEATEFAARERFDAVLMDVQMPVMDGVEATRRIRVLPPPACRVPILGLTANVLAGERERYLAAGMDLCLTKPVAWEELLAALAGVAASTVAEARGATPADVSGGEPPLLEGVAAGPGDARLSGLLGRALEEVERGCARLRELPPGSPELAEEAHRLKGAAGLYGLKRVSVLAGEVEAAARDGREVAGLVERLVEAVAATREALREAGLPGDPRTAGA